jgi:hypothetical protein
MKKEIMNGVQGLPIRLRRGCCGATRAAEANTKNGRQKTQKAQEQKSPLASFALFRGYSVNVNFPDRLGFQAGSPRKGAAAS